VAALGFALVRGGPHGGPRTGRLDTPHGALATPAFLPVASSGAVRGIAPRELFEVGVQGLLANAVHLALRPGAEQVRALGGLHAFMGWSGPLLTDSGGFQIHSLDHLAERSEEGVRFRSPHNGDVHFVSPERAIEIQEALGADLIVTLDEFDPIPVERDEDPARARELLERTLRWAARCLSARRREDQWLFGIVQGGGSAERREESAARTQALGFGAFALGGLGLGESPERRDALVQASLAPLAPEAPRYLMGLGEPPDLVDAIARGIDLFDCVVPTRNGRHGVAYTASGRLNLRNARHREADQPLDPSCICPTCRGFSRAYLRHLLLGREALGARLVSLHNLAYYMRLLLDAREAIVEERFETWREDWARAYRAGPPSSQPRAATQSPA
jgi:queuine tRNA-ribosyltransferase